MKKNFLDVNQLKYMRGKNKDRKGEYYRLHKKDEIEEIQKKETGRRGIKKITNNGNNNAGSSKDTKPSKYLKMHSGEKKRISINAGDY